MANMTIDEATADTTVTGVEKIPVSDGGMAKSVTTAQIKDFVFAVLAASDVASSTDLSDDGIYVKQGGTTKRLTGTTLAQAVLGYACGLVGITGPNGNEIFVIDDSGTKKTITLAQVAAYITANSGDMFAELVSADSMADSDLVMVKQGGAVKKGTLASLAAFALGKFAAFVVGTSNVEDVQGTEKIAVVSGGVTKYVTVAQMLAAASGGVATPGTTTSGNIPTWNDNTGSSLGAGLAVGTSIRSQGTADNNTIPTESAVRAAIGDNNVTGPSSTTEDKIPQWSSTAKTLKNGLSLSTSVDSPGVDTKVPTERAVRSAIAAAVAGLGAGDVKGPTTTTENLVPQWDSTQKKLKSGLGVVTSVGGTGADTNIPTEKAVRDAITAATDGLGDGDVQKSGTPASGSLAKWTAAGKIESGPTVTATVGVTGVDTSVPTEKAVRTAISNATADAIAKSGTPTSGKLAKFASASTVVDGPSVTTSVGTTGADTAVPTEKAVRTAITEAITDALAVATAAAATVTSKVSAPVSHTENNIPTWGASNELKAGKAVVTVLANNASDGNIPTEKAVRDALPVAVTNVTDGLMSAADKVKLDGMPDLGAVAEINAALDDSDVIIVKDNDSTWKKSLITRLWTWLMGKLSTFKIDDLAAGDDNTDLDATTARHGLCPKFPNDNTKFLRGDGSFAVPAGSDDFTGDSGSGGVHGLVPAPASGDANDNKFLSASGAWATPPSAAGVDIPGATAIDALADADVFYVYDASAIGYRKVTAAQIRALVAGTKQYDTIFIPAGAMTPSADNGATPGAVKFTNTTHDTLAFPSTADKSAEFSVVFPDDWDKSSVKVKLLWTYYNSTAGQAGQHVKFLVGAVTCGDGIAISNAPTTTVGIADLAQSANEFCKTDASAALLPEGTAGNGNIVHFTVTRDADYAPDGGDALPTEAMLLGAVVQFGRTADYTGW